MEYKWKENICERKREEDLYVKLTHKKKRKTKSIRQSQEWFFNVNYCQCKIKRKTTKKT